MAQTVVNVLWTGGYDSTYRIVELTRHDFVIQPFYLSDKIRRSEKYELNAIRAITADIERHPETKGKILPLIIQPVSELQHDDEIVEAYKRLRDVSYIGPQYIWLAEFAKTNRGLELCIEIDDSHTGATYCIMKHGKLIKVCEGDYAYWMLEEENSSKDVLTVFGFLNFPLIETTKLDMLEGYKQMGFSETMKLTWFCHTPVNGEPCGVCNPCKQTIKAGMGFRIPPAGMVRHENELVFTDRGWWRYWKKIRYRVSGY